MKDYNDLLNSGISDELLAAYIDGNTTQSENQLIENFLNGDSMLSETYEIAHDGVSLGSNLDWELHKGDFGFLELGLPPVISESELSPTADIFQDLFVNGEHDEIFSSDENNIFNSSGDSFLDAVDSNDIDSDLDTSDIDDGLDDLFDL